MEVAAIQRIQKIRESQDRAEGLPKHREHLGEFAHKNTRIGKVQAGLSSILGYFGIRCILKDLRCNCYNLLISS